MTDTRWRVYGFLFLGQMRMNQVERIALTAVLVGLWSWLCFTDLDSGNTSPSNWPWALLSSVLLAGFVWWLSGRKPKQRRGF